MGTSAARRGTTPRNGRLPRKWVSPFLPPVDFFYYVGEYAPQPLVEDRAEFYLSETLSEGDRLPNSRANPYTTGVTNLWGQCNGREFCQCLIALARG